MRQEYTGTLKDEKELTDKAVLKKFNETVVKQRDGYYVRLPWKGDHVKLPDNWSIALRRLKATSQVYKSNQTFLQQYDEIFQEQIKKGVLEEVSQPQKSSNVTHYLPHHAVLTPKKTTPKMRVVLDASAHYRDKPSLNDVLHQGSLILLKIVGMIMRFHMGKIALTSVRLHEKDRDATRCLWVRDIKRPPEENNIVVYRFTRAKRFFQGLWKKYYKWDQRLGEEDAVKWQHICEESEGFTKEIPRRIADRDATYKLVMFTDASTQVMCAAAYLSNENNQNLLIAKSRLPSIQCHHTIPKLEMTAITMGTRLALNTTSDVFILSDSEIALNWLKVPPKAKGTGVLVANRVKEIIKIVRRLEEEGAKVRFGYIHTRDNPADEGTSGSSAKEFANSLWWTGPPSTKQDSNTWPEESRNLTERLGEPTKARIRKAIPDLGGEEVKGPIIGLGMRDAMNVLLRMHQTQHSAVIEHISNAKLNLRHDSHGITRCYGRLENSTLGEDAKNPAFVAPNTVLARLIIQEAHRFNNLPFRYPDMMDLPERRVVHGRPFLHVRLDYFGPWKLREDQGETSKAYRCIFTCTTARLVQLELVRNNGTTAFLNAVRRFIARRGVPYSITCDNATTFPLGEEILKETAVAFEGDEETKKFVADQEIEWRNITPYAPWQGGFYERLIQSVKRSLQKPIGHRTLDAETLATLLTEVEASLNSRPLTYQEVEYEENPGISPIDFIQKEIRITYPL
ncbi:integrase core domain protein [Ancylostoma duodenale]|uniref:Integrase core domain protein n=1 Tax=Ancylostoma duodenale TaxID=51022 RepID=A0A0C2GVU1_9BILA|nr:integrase core domain protein [Ancylostoma duodenale]